LREVLKELYSGEEERSGKPFHTNLCKAIEDLHFENYECLSDEGDEVEIYASEQIYVEAVWEVSITYRGKTVILDVEGFDVVVNRAQGADIMEPEAALLMPGSYRMRIIGSTLVIEI
jgi:hypothetical protein